MTNPRDKGKRGEYLCRNLLREYTGLKWERIPSSGALPYLKGDLYVPNEKNKFCIEVKNYKDPVVSEKIFTQLRSNGLILWWQKVKNQAEHMEAKPILFFKHNRSPFYAAINFKPKNVNYMYLNWIGAYVTLAEDLLKKEEIDFV